MTFQHTIQMQPMAADKDVIRKLEAPRRLNRSPGSNGTIMHSGIQEHKMAKKLPTMPFQDRILVRNHLTNMPLFIFFVDLNELKIFHFKVFIYCK